MYNIHINQFQWNIYLLNFFITIHSEYKSSQSSQLFLEILFAAVPVCVCMFSCIFQKKKNLKWKSASVYLIFAVITVL